MMLESLFLLAVIALFIFICGYFSVGEAAVSSVPSARAEAWGEENPRLSRLIDWELSERQTVIIAILVSHNVFSVAASSFATVLATKTLGGEGMYIATGVLTLMMVLFADFLPKCIGMSRGERTFASILPVLKISSYIFAPVIRILEWLVDRFSSLFGVTVALESAIVTRDEIEQLIANGELSGAIESSERRMIDGVIGFDETRVSEIMVPRISMDAFEVELNIGDLFRLMPDWEHSRVPVYRNTPDDIVGVVYIKDMIPFLRRGKSDTPLESFMRRPLFVPETMMVGELFKIMRTRKTHFAVIVDEYGGTAGIVTLEDVLEEIVGEINDEYDTEDLPIILLGENTYRVRCTESLEDVEDVLGTVFDCDDVDSVGGYVLDRLGRFPALGDCFRDGDWVVKVTSVGEHRVNEVIFTKVKKPEEATASPHEEE